MAGVQLVGHTIIIYNNNTKIVPIKTMQQNIYLISPASVVGKFNTFQYDRPVYWPSMVQYNRPVAMHGDVDFLGNIVSQLR